MKRKNGTDDPMDINELELEVSHQITEKMGIQEPETDLADIANDPQMNQSDQHGFAKSPRLTFETATPTTNRFGFGWKGASSIKRPIFHSSQASTISFESSNQSETKDDNGKKSQEIEKDTNTQAVPSKCLSVVSKRKENQLEDIKADNSLISTRSKGKGATVFKTTLPPTRASTIAASRRISKATSQFSKTALTIENRTSKIKKPSVDTPASSTDSPSESTHFERVSFSTEKKSIQTAFRTIFGGQERLDTIEELLKIRSKINKYNVKARCEEQLGYIRDLKPALRNLTENVKEFDMICAEFDQIYGTDKENLKAEMREAQSALVRAEASASDLRRQLEKSQKELHDLKIVVERGSEEVLFYKKRNKEILDSSKALEQVVANLNQQLEGARNDNGALLLELKLYQSRFSDRTEMFEEIKRENERDLLKKEQEIKERFCKEILRREQELQAARLELLCASTEKESMMKKLQDTQNALSIEKDAKNKADLRICALESESQATTLRLKSALDEITEFKKKVQQKEEEVSNVLQSMAQIQSFASVANGKLELEKKALSDKVDVLESKYREMELKDSSDSNTIRELRAELQHLRQYKAESAAKLSLMEERYNQAHGDLQEHARQAVVEKELRLMIESQMREIRTEHIAVNAQMEAVKAEMKHLLKTNEEMKLEHNDAIISIRQNYEHEKGELMRKIELSHEQTVSLQSEVKTLRERASHARGEDLEELCAVKREADVLRLRLKEMSIQGTHNIGEKEKLILELQEKVKQGEKLRRTMHNTIQELRGNVRVYARTRPFLPSDQGEQANVTSAISCEYDGQTIKLQRIPKSTMSASTNDVGLYSFTFDKVFAPSAGQDNVFDEVAEFVQSAIDGYHVCIFSYGQTGSGKTHTMQGSGNGQMRGIIPRSIEKVLQDCANLESHGWKYSIQASFLEIYNETLKDLLTAKEDAEKKLSIKKCVKGTLYVPDLRMIDIHNINQVESLMEKASRSRSIASTDMNSHSSRSHCIFTLHLQGTNDTEGIILDGKLHLVDLAGSERASRSNVSGDRLRETQNINKSLSCLADVFNAIGNKSAHIPFRNSKLTYLLQNSLSGDGKTMMMVNLSPTLDSAAESLCTLRFAQQVNQCELGKPKRQIKSKKDT